MCRTNCWKSTKPRTKTKINPPRHSGYKQIPVPIGIGIFCSRLTTTTALPLWWFVGRRAQSKHPAQTPPTKGKFWISSASYLRSNKKRIKLGNCQQAPRSQQTKLLFFLHKNQKSPIFLGRAPKKIGIGCSFLSPQKSSLQDTPPDLHPIIYKHRHYKLQKKWRKQPKFICQNTRERTKRSVIFNTN